MKLTIDRDAFVAALTRVVGVCPQKSALPILSNCLLETDEIDGVVLRGSDLELAVRTRCKAEVKKPGSVALSARRLFDTVKSVPAGPVTLAVEPNFWAVLDADRIHARIAGVKADDFPPFAAAGVQLPLQLKGALLLDAIEKTFFATSLNEARAVFTGALLRATAAGALEAVATDGHRLSVFRAKHEGGDLGPELDRGVIVPRQALAELRRMVQRDDVVSFGVKQNDLVVSSGETTLSARLIAGTFPSFTKVVPKLDGALAVFERDVLRAALKRAGLYSCKGNNNVRLSLSEGVLELYAFDVEAGEYTERVACSYAGEPKIIGFNYRYLLEMLDVVESLDVRVQLIDAESPSVWLDPAREESLFVLMPMQV